MSLLCFSTLSRRLWSIMTSLIGLMCEAENGLRPFFPPNITVKAKNAQYKRNANTIKYGLRRIYSKNSYKPSEYAMTLFVCVSLVNETYSTCCSSFSFDMWCLSYVVLWDQSPLINSALHKYLYWSTLQNMLIWFYKCIYKT